MRHSTSNASLEVFCVYDRNYDAGLIGAIGSLYLTCTSQVPLRVLVVRENVGDLLRTLDILCKHTRALQNLTITIIPDSVVERCKSLSFAHHFTPAICYRLFYFEIVRDQPRHVIYFDLDMIWRRPPTELVLQLPANYPLGAVEQDAPESSRKLLGQMGIDTYFNSGLLLFDTRFLKDILDRLSSAQNLLARLAPESEYLDQDALNAAFAGTWATLPAIWNYDTRKATDDGLRAQSRAGLLHATGSEKPWHIPNSHIFSKAFGSLFAALGIPCRFRYSLKDSWRRFARRLTFG